MRIWPFATNVDKDFEVFKTIYEFKVPALTGGIIDISLFEGRKILIVNTASKCGFTPQFEELEKLSQQYKDKLVVLGFPSNDFLWQDPGTNNEIASFCATNYGVTFPMAAKVKVIGRNKAAIYRWLTEVKYNKLKNSRVKWNFQKYLIDEAGKLTHVFGSNQNPLCKEIVAAIER